MSVRQQLAGSHCAALRSHYWCVFLLGAIWLSPGTAGAQKLVPPEFTVVPIDGDPATGHLVGFTKSWRFVLQSGERASFQGEDLLSLRRTNVSRPVSISGAYVRLANGNRIRATSHLATQESLRANSELMGILEIPLERVEAIVFGQTELIWHEAFERRLQAGARKQDVVTLSNGDETAGTFTGMDEEFIRLERPGTVGAVSIPRAGVLAITFSTDLISFPKPQGLHAQAFLADGTEITLLDGWVDRSNLRGRTAFEREIATPLEQLVALEFRGGRITFLSDLDPTNYRHTPYLGLPFPYQRDRSVTGQVMSLRGQVLHKGLGMHSRSEIAYALDRRYKRFEALVGIDDETNGQGSVIFRVLLDDREAWQSELVTGQSVPQPVKLDVSKASRLTLVVDFGTLGDVQDHADWGEARLIR